MMEPIAQPKTFKIFQLIKMTGMYLSGVNSTTNSSGTGLGVGFYSTLQEAEHMRTLEILKDTTPAGSVKSTWHVFELEFPNPAYKE